MSNIFDPQLQICIYPSYCLYPVNIDLHVKIRSVYCETPCSLWTEYTSEAKFTFKIGRACGWGKAPGEGKVDKKISFILDVFEKMDLYSINNNVEHVNQFYLLFATYINNFT